jgi:hypothetical protein
MSAVVASHAFQPGRLRGQLIRTCRAAISQRVAGSGNDKDGLNLVDTRRKFSRACLVRPKRSSLRKSEVMQLTNRSAHVFG